MVCRDRTYLRVLILWISLAPLFSSAADPEIAAPKRCPLDVVRSLFAQTQLNLQTYGVEVKEQGWKRLLIKKASVDLDPGDRKLFGVLQEYRPHPGETWYHDATRSAGQLFPKLVTRKVLGRPYEFRPFARAYEELEDRILPPGMTLTLPVTLVGGFVLARYTFWPMLDQFLSAQEKKKHEQDVQSWIEKDYRCESIRRELAAGRITPAQARLEAANLQAAYQYYFHSLSELEKHGISPESPEGVATLLGDPKTAARLAPVFKDLMVLQDPRFWHRKDFTYPAGSTGPSLSDQEIVGVARVIQAKTVVQSQIPDWISNPPSQDPQGVYSRWREEPFTRSVLSALGQHQITQERATQLLMHDLEWRSRFQQWAAVGVQPMKLNEQGNPVRPLTLEDAEEDLLTQAK